MASSYSAAAASPGDAYDADAYGAIAGDTVTDNAGDVLDRDLVGAVLGVWIGVFGVFLACRLGRLVVRHVRLLACLNDDKQRLFRRAGSYSAALERHLVDAPLFRKRHVRELRLSTAVNVGTLPTRLQTLVLCGYVAINIAFCFEALPPFAGRQDYLTTLRHRTGMISGFNLVPLVLLAGRRSPLAWMLDVSFATFNLVHRWLGRLVVVEAIVHTGAHCLLVVEDNGGWSVLALSAKADPIIATGVVATSCFLLLLLHSPSALRHAYYETFLHLHILLALAGIAVLWYHISPSALTRPFLLAATLLWAIERAGRIDSLVRTNVGAGGTHAVIEALPGTALRVTLHVARPWRFRPGQHLFLHVPSVGWHTSHPFSIAWSDSAPPVYEKLPSANHGPDPPRKTTFSLLIRPRTGFTAALHARAAASPDNIFRAPALVEGPYGAQNLCSYGTVLLFAAGVGISHQLPFVRHLIASSAAGMGAARRVALVWVVRGEEHVEWVRAWLAEVMGMPGRKGVLGVKIFVTRPMGMRGVRSAGCTVQMIPGRPDVGALVGMEQRVQVGAMAVSVCGPGGMADDVREACRRRGEDSAIDFVESAFSW